MSQKVKVLLVGAAFSADLHMDAYSRCPELAQIVAICDKDISRVHSLAKRYGLSEYEAFEDYGQAIAAGGYDVVDVCLPNFLHCDVVIKALDAGFHAICEKPLAVTVAEGEKMLAAAQKANKHIYYAEEWLFAPSLLKALEIVEEGGIGAPVFYRGRECHSGSHSPFAQTIQYCGGGSMVHLGIHPIGFMLALKDRQWTELCAMTTGGLTHNMVQKTMEGEDWATCLIRFADGSTAVLEANYVTVGGMEDAVDIYGTQGCLHVDMTFTSPISCFSVPGLSYTVEKADVTTGWSRPAVDEKFNLGYVGEIRHFMECAAKNVEAKIGLRGVDGYEALKVVNYIYQSAKEGRTIYNPALK